jgi:hypothetical protein
MKSCELPGLVIFTGYLCSFAFAGPGPFPPCSN